MINAASRSMSGHRATVCGSITVKETSLSVAQPGKKKPGQKQAKQKNGKSNLGDRLGDILEDVLDL